MSYPEDNFREIADAIAHDILDEDKLRELWTVCVWAVRKKSGNRWNQAVPEGELEIDFFNRFLEERDELLGKFDPRKGSFRSYASQRVHWWCQDLVRKRSCENGEYESEAWGRQGVRTPDGSRALRQEHVLITRESAAKKREAKNPLGDLVYEIKQGDENGFVEAIDVMLDEVVAAGKWVYSSVLLVDIRVKYFGMSDRKACNLMPTAVPESFRECLEAMFPWSDEVKLHQLHIGLRPKLDRIWREFFSHALDEVVSKRQIANAVEILVAAIKSLQGDFDLSREVWDSKLKLARKKLQDTEEASSMPFWAGYLELVSRRGRP